MGSLTSVHKPRGGGRGFLIAYASVILLYADCSAENSLWSGGGLELPKVGLRNHTYVMCEHGPIYPYDQSRSGLKLVVTEQSTRFCSGIFCPVVRFVPPSVMN